ncbi:MAG: ATP-binding protein [Nitrospirota bacterium]
MKQRQPQATNFIKRTGITLFLVWTFMAAVSLVWNIHELRHEILREVAAEARAHLELNVAYRKVIGSFGGVYVPSREIAPNPYLQVPNRDITATDGQRLTLVNASHMIRTVFAYQRAKSPEPVLNKLVSRNPTNPLNRADEWESRALRSFEQGVQEASETSMIDGKPYFRMIMPFATEQGCLKCHASQGYRIGDVRGGISIAVPMGPYFKTEYKTRRTIVVTHLALWLVATGSLVVFTRKRQEQEEKIVESAWRFQVLSDSANDWVFWLDGEGRFVYMSPSSTTITGYAPGAFTANPALLMNIIHPDDRANWEHHVTDMHDPEHEEIELRIVSRSGEVKWLSHVCAPIVVDGRFLGRRASNRDITDKWKLGEQLRQAQKMEAVGLLAGGIAHDFNNILTAIIGYGNILKLKIPPDDPLSANVEQILSSSARAAGLTQSLLTFSRKQLIHPKEVDLNAVVSRFKQFVARVLREDIELVIAPAPEPLVIMADQGQIDQLLMNLATNARDAMPQGGSLTIATSRAVMDDHIVRQQGFGKPGRYAVLTVSDTGVGMDEKTRARVFEPFFTTKELGKGTGLGLAMIYGAVQQNNGYIAVASEPGKGTAFTLYFPLLASPNVAPSAPAPVVWERGTETVLIAEDDPALRRLSSTVLNEFGYTTIEAADGEEAVALFRERGDAIALVILDVIMPKKNGKEVYEELRRIRPGLKTLFISGYTADIVHEKGILDQDLPFLSKPIAPQALLRKVREVLGARS